MIQKLLSKLLALTVVIILSAVMGGFVGWSWAKRASDLGIINQQESDAKEVSKHEDKKDIVRKRVEFSIAKVNKISGPCLNEPNSDEYLNSLQLADRAAQSVLD